MSVRFISYESQKKAEGFIDGVVWANDGALHVQGLYTVPTGMYVVVVEDDDFDGEQQPPVGWALCQELVYNAEAVEE